MKKRLFCAAFVAAYASAFAENNVVCGTDCIDLDAVSNGPLVSILSDASGRPSFSVDLGVFSLNWTKDVVAGFAHVKRRCKDSKPEYYAVGGVYKFDPGDGSLSASLQKSVLGVFTLKGTGTASASIPASPHWVLDANNNCTPTGFPAYNGKANLNVTLSASAGSDYIVKITGSAAVGADFEFPVVVTPAGRRASASIGKPKVTNYSAAFGVEVKKFGVSTDVYEYIANTNGTGGWKKNGVPV